MAAQVGGTAEQQKNSDTFRGELEIVADGAKIVYVLVQLGLLQLD